MNGFYYLYSVKKIILLTLLFSLSVICLAGESKIRPFHLELFCDFSDITNAQASQNTGGLKFTSPLLEIKSAARNGKHNYGFCFSTGRFIKQFPVELKYGNLSGGGSLARLNSPELSNGTSPFSGSQISPGALSASLPGYSSFSKPESIFFQLKLKQFASNPFYFCLNTWISPDYSSPLVSALLSDKFFSNQLLLNVSCTAGKFFYDDNSSSSWFLESPYYHEDSHFCSLYQFSLEYKNKNGKGGFFTGFTGALYETPFGPYTSLYRADVKLTVKKSEFYTSIFFNPNEDCLTSSGKKLTPGCQFKAGLLTKKPIITKKSTLIFIKFGTNIYSKINLTEAIHPFRINAGLQLSSDLTAISLSVSDSFNLHSPSPELAPDEIRNSSITFQVKNSWYFKLISPSLLFSAEIKFNENSSSNSVKYKLQFNSTNNTKVKIGSSYSLTFSSDNNVITDKKISAALNCKLTLPALSLTGKISFETDL